MPQSVTSQWINLVGLICLMCSLSAATLFKLPAVPSALGCLLAYALPIAVLELLVLKVHRRETTGLDWDRAGRPVNWPRVATKLLGLAATLAAVGVVHSLVRIYPIEDMATFGTVAAIVLGVGLPFIIVYVVIVDSVMRDPEDSYWHLGMAVLGRGERVDTSQIRHLAAGWLVKGFFLPIMAVYLITTISRLGAGTDMLTSGHIGATRWLTEFVAGCELSIVCVGYSLTLRVTDNHIRSVNPLVWGWVVTLACYEPFNTIVSGKALAYKDGLYWYDWLENQPTLSIAWCALLGMSFLVWLWATAAFGLRWSNLTNRGIITNGPYRFTKHPDYVAKSIFFWLISMPFLSAAGPIDALKNCLLLGLINLIYFLRARAEERHLSADPAYAAYALAMNERSIFRPFAVVLPALRFRAQPA